MEIIFHTTLDEAKEVVALNYMGRYEWPFAFHVPAIGSIIKLPVTGGPPGHTYELEVLAVTYNPHAASPYIEVELYIPRHTFGDVSSWTDWLKKGRQP